MGFFNVKPNYEKELARQEKELEAASKKAEVSGQILDKWKERLEFEVEAARNRQETNLVMSRIKNPDAELKRREEYEKQDKTLQDVKSIGRRR